MIVNIHNKILIFKYKELSLQPFTKVNKRQLIACEIATVIILLGLIFWSVKPLLEEWGVLNAFNSRGIAFIFDNGLSIAMRPLHLTAYALQWLLGNGHPFGVTAAVGVIMMLRYIVVRWAVTPLIKGQTRWLLATLAAVLIGWSGAWLGRFTPATLSAVFFFAVLGFSIRLSHKWSYAWALGCIISTSFILLSYQGLAFCLLVMPLLPLFCTDSVKKSKIETLHSIIRISFPIGLTLIIYGLYSIIMTLKQPEGYEATLAGDSARLLTLEGFINHINTAFSTAFGQELLLLPILIFIALFIHWYHTPDTINPKYLMFDKVKVSLLVVLLPCLSTIYISSAHIRDTDRVLYPLSVGFVIVCVLIAIKNRNANINNQKSNHAPFIIVLILLTSSIITASHVKKYATIQSDVLNQTISAIDNNHSTSSIIIRDMTGTLGDVYTLLPPIMTDALAINGKKIDATICTPISVDRLHPIAQRYPIPSTERCEEMANKPNGTLILTAQFINNSLTIK